MQRFGIAVNQNELQKRCFQIANFIVIVYSDTQCLYLKYESYIRHATVYHNSSVDTIFRKILPVVEQGKQWLYLFGENGMLLQICVQNNQPPIVNTIQCKNIILFFNLY